MLEGILVNGLVRSGIYALLAIGVSLIFGVARMINLAFTSFYMLGAYGLYTFASRLHIHPLPAMLISLILTTGIGLATYKIFIDRVREHHVTVMLITMAVALIFQETLLMIFKGHYLVAPTFLTGYATILGVKVLYQHLLVLGIVLIALLAVWVLLSRTRLGVAIRAVAQDSEIANLMGINVSRILLVTMSLASALAAIAGVAIAPTQTLSPQMWTAPLVTIMAIVVLGGLGSVKGSLVGAFIIGFVETSVVFLWPQLSFLQGAIALAVMVTILLIRPEGLFGIVFEEERL